MLILSLAELVAILIILQLYPLYSLRVPHKHKKLRTTELLLINTSTLQHNTYVHAYHKLIKDGTRGVRHFSTSSTGISHLTLLDYNSTHLTRKLGMPMENLQ